MHIFLIDHHTVFQTDLFHVVLDKYIQYIQFYKILLNILYNFVNICRNHLAHTRNIQYSQSHRKLLPIYARHYNTTQQW